MNSACKDLIVKHNKNPSGISIHTDPVTYTHCRVSYFEGRIFHKIPYSHFSKIKSPESSRALGGKCFSTIWRETMKGANIGEYHPIIYALAIKY